MQIYKFFVTSRIVKQFLFGKNLAELTAFALEAGLARFAGRQIADWLYKKGATDIAQMTNISAAGRASLSERFSVGRSAPVRESISSDGTKKYLFNEVEAVMIPDGERATLCLSSQSGCRMGCAFCATGRMGFRANLSADEILNQFASLPEFDRLTNIVYMGMGEPLDNLEPVLGSLEVLTADWGYALSPTRITVSTAGVAPALERFLAETTVHLAVSLHNPFADGRAELMPIEKAYPIEKIVQIIRRADFSGQRRVSFEYVVLAGLNDSPRHVAELARLLNGLSCRINLIRFHKVPNSPFFSPPPEKVEWFRDALTRKGLRTTIRASRGEDIEAACGLLATSGIAVSEKNSIFARMKSNPR